jgi:mannose-1-phosphate guanylyltransferase
MLAPGQASFSRFSALPVSCNPVSALGDTTAIVLCAGLGTRLRPLTLELPKPLLPVGDRQLLAHIADVLLAAGFSRMCVNTHHLPERFPNVIRQLPIEVNVVHEPEIRGTAGGVAGFRVTTNHALVWNGDIYCRPPIQRLLAFAGRAPMVLAVRPTALGEGTVGLDGTRVVRLRGERFGTETRSADYIGVSLLGRAALDALPETGCLFQDVALPALRRGDRFLETVETEEPWSDIGTPAAYLELNLAWLRNRSAFVGQGASVDADVELRGSVVGAGARVTGSGALERVVVWPNASARAPLSDAVVTPRAVVPITR